jgi:hypothetical protein
MTFENGAGTYSRTVEIVTIYNGKEYYGIDSDGNINNTRTHSWTIDTTKPTSWQWSQTISSTAYIPMVNGKLCPFTADEWNNFVDKVNEIRTWASSVGLTVSGNKLSHVQSGVTDFAVAYKNAVTAIKNISGYGGLLPTTFPVTLRASLFVGNGSLQQQLNAVLDYSE